MCPAFYCCFFFFFNDTATTEIYTLSLHDALPISAAYQALGSMGFSRQEYWSGVPLPSPILAAAASGLGRTRLLGPARELGAQRAQLLARVFADRGFVERHFGDEAAGPARHHLAASSAPLRPAHGERALCARDADVHQAPLFLQPLLLRAVGLLSGAGPSVVAGLERQHALVHADQQHVRPFQPR